MTTYIAFPLSPALAQKTTQTIVQIRSDPSAKPNRQALVALVNELADQGIDHFFIQSIKHAGLGILKIKAAEMGLQTFKRGLQPLLKSVVKGMNDDQVLRVLEFMEGILVEKD